MRKQPGKLTFVLSFGLLFSIPLAINYYIFKFLLTIFFSSVSWDYSLIELLFVSLTCILLGLLFGMYVQSKRRMEVD
ncbi:hypothetical protein [Oceanobacillus kapialis]|uniref:Uncharacterized protein n=1 Tax=Oceanobacillus kapialis TaxID=481353 RepID=A0ABW5Q3L0_9BACI